MVILIGGGTHTGKTLLAQRLLEKHHFPYLSIDHLKMGLIRSGLCPLTPDSEDEALTAFIWPVVREMIKTAVENRQNLIVEGCYIPADFIRDFAPAYLEHIRYVCLILSENFIRRHYAEIRDHANDIEHRLDSEAPPMETLLAENRRNLELCRKFGTGYVLVDGEYDVDWDFSA